MKSSLEVTSANIIFLQNLGCVFDQRASLYCLACAASGKTIDGFNFVFFFKPTGTLAIKICFQYLFRNLKEMIWDKGKHFVPPCPHSSFLFGAYLQWHLICYHVLEHFPVASETVS